MTMHRLDPPTRDGWSAISLREGRPPPLTRERRDRPRAAWPGCEHRVAVCARVHPGNLERPCRSPAFEAAAPAAQGAVVHRTRVPRRSGPGLERRCEWCGAAA